MYPSCVIEAGGAGEALEAGGESPSLKDVLALGEELGVDTQSPTVQRVFDFLLVDEAD
ncbi:hypothetical protein IQ243_22630 [Nostocales cyanobacterium LEGE 11386]|nr:hypothetical protein [Nostocales cyanobacterium LEGE 11386]